MSEGKGWGGNGVGVDEYREREQGLEGSHTNIHINQRTVLHCKS